jgi:polyferredoxin
MPKKRLPIRIARLRQMKAIKGRYELINVVFRLLISINQGKVETTIGWRGKGAEVEVATVTLSQLVIQLVNYLTVVRNIYQARRRRRRRRKKKKKKKEQYFMKELTLLSLLLV